MIQIFNQLLNSGDLTHEHATNLARAIVKGELPPEQMAGVLIALRMKKESASELSAFAEVFLQTTAAFPKKYPLLMDVCGTGGDHCGTFNVSTGVALILASGGVAVAKHGNRGVSSSSGSADVLEALKIKADLNIEDSQRSIDRDRISFLHAPAFYPVFAAIAPVRKKLGVYTLFNALGPALNPAPLTHQMMGVYDEALLEKMAKVLQHKNLKRAFIVRGTDGLDEVSIGKSTEVCSLDQGKIERFTVHPSQFGLKNSEIEEVRGGDAHANAKILMSIFHGEKSAKRDLLVINAAMALLLCEKEENPAQAAARVSQWIDQGLVLKLIERLQAKGAA